MKRASRRRFEGFKMTQHLTSTKFALPSVAPAAPAATDIKRMLLLYGGIAVGVIAVAAMAYYFWTRKPVPRLNAKIEEIVRYVEDTGFRKLPVDRQFVYLKAMEERGADMKTAYEQKKLTEDEYSAAKEYAWFGKQLSHMERYLALRNSSERQKFLDKIIDRGIKKGEKDKKGGDDDEPKVTRDKTLEKVLPLTWPRETREQWELFRKAYREREKARLAASPSSAKNPTTKPE